MPHLILEYSSNLSSDAAMNQLLGKLHDALGSIESFESDRIKSRALRFNAYRIGADDRRGFVHATVLFSPGRPEALRRELVKKLLTIIISEVRSASGSFSSSVEIRQFEPGMYATERDER
ncbi:MAG TPA: 5-carboxymethyl-2-hydroxymuconate isomerase [Candidatus Binatia bacterium]|nr:5-carboxymethyl-2-hydroxymuconate isomerase [Candidatus Binatia bacterium]